MQTFNITNTDTDFIKLIENINNILNIIDPNNEQKLIEQYSDNTIDIKRFFEIIGFDKHIIMLWDKAKSNYIFSGISIINKEYIIYSLDSRNKEMIDKLFNILEQIDYDFNNLTPINNPNEILSLESNEEHKDMFLVNNKYYKIS